MTAKRKLEVENAFADHWTCTICFLCTVSEALVVIATYFGPGPWGAE
jgi:hypothetical protein